ncbi:MAG: HU family DNA-binding protein [Desulfobacteraceae bacterium]
MLEQLKASLESGEDVLVTGFGKFCVKDKAQRRGRNPDFIIVGRHAEVV